MTTLTEFVVVLATICLPFGVAAIIVATIWREEW